MLLIKDKERFLCNLLFVVLPQYASCGKKEPASTHSYNVTYVFTCTRPLYAVVPLCNLKTFLSPPDPLLPGNSHCVRCAGDDACPKTYYQHPGHCYNCLLLTASSSPYAHELPKKDRRSLRIAIHEFSMRVALMNPGPIPVILPFQVASPVEYSLGVSPTKLAIFFPLVKRLRSPNSKTSLIAVNHPIPGALLAISKAFLYRSLWQSWRRYVRNKV